VQSFSSIVKQQGKAAGSVFSKKEGTPFFKPMVQPKLSINQPNDIYEQEADAVAEKVMRATTDQNKAGQNTFFQPVIPSISSVQRKCEHCEEEERKMQRKALNGEESKAAGDIENYVDRLHNGGQPLSGEARNFFEPRFGRDFSGVKIHTDAVSAKSAQSINALAYTTGNHIVFNSGQYSPGTESGKRLLGHELTHVIQQSSNSVQAKQIQRCPDAATNTQYDAVAAQVRAHAEYTALAPANRVVADDIITRSRTRDDCMHFIRRLLDLFNTPTNQSAAVAATATGHIANAAQAERDRLATSEGGRLQNVEEATANAANLQTVSPPPRSWGHMATFKMDRSDFNNIVVQVKIRVNGDPTIVSNIQAQEDGIEKAAQQMGYILDVIFVNTTGTDVFQVTANPALAVDAGNWGAYSANPSAYTHEIHHLIGLEDRYDYTVHAYNARYSIPQRLRYFQQQLSRPMDPHVNESLMGSGTQLLDDDICRVTQLNFATCMATRQARRNTMNTARFAAFAKCFRVFQSLANIVPSAPVPFADETQELRRRSIISKANLIFGTQVNETQLQDIVTTMRDRLTPGITMRFAPTSDSNCTGNAYYVINMTPPLVMCNNFFSLSADDQIKSYLRAAAQLARIDNAIPVAASASFDCTTTGAGFNSADTWAKFIWCASTI
jgi:hypothetical protein